MDIQLSTGRKVSFAASVREVHAATRVTRWKCDAREAFSLIEVTLAIGVMAFALLAIFGLIPVGLGSFRTAKDISITSQIEEKIFSEVKSMTFDNLTNTTRYAPAAAGSVYQFPERFFTEDGTETSSADSTTIYHVNIRVVPVTTPLEKSGGTTLTNVDLASVTIQVAYDPSNQKLATNATTGLWTGALSSAPAATGAVPLYTYSAFVARSL